MAIRLRKNMHAATRWFASVYAGLQGWCLAARLHALVPSQESSQPAGGRQLQPVQSGEMTYWHSDSR